MIKRILVLCIGNICRSPMAEGLLKEALPGHEISSAGLGALVGQPADPHAVALMQQQGIDISAHRARQLESWMIVTADLVLVMDMEQKRHLEQQYPLCRGIVLWLFGIPLIDTLCVIIRRLKRKASPFAADRTHIHHVFEHNRLSVKQTVLLLTLIQAALVCIGVIFYLTHAPAALIFGSFVALMLVYYFLIQRYKGATSLPGGPAVVIVEEQ
jgi:protein-tyrosine phosphatase